MTKAKLDLNKVENLWDKGLTLPAIAEKIGYFHSHLYSVVRNQNWYNAGRRNRDHWPSISNIKKLWERGSSLSSIAKLHGCTRSTIEDLVKGEIWYDPSRGIKVPSQTKIHRLFKQGLSLTQIGNKFGCSEYQIRKKVSRCEWYQKSKVGAKVPSLSNIRRLWNSDYGLEAIAKKFGCSYDAVYVKVKDCKWYNQEKLKQTVPNKVLVKAASLQSRGFSTAKISTELGISENRIVYALKKNGRFNGRDQRAVVRDKAYHKTARDLTQWVVRNFPEHIQVVRRGHVDHKFPVSLAEINGLSLYEVCHPVNLIYISAKANFKKYMTPSIDVKTLRKLIREFVRENGDIYKDSRHYSCQGTYTLKRGRYENV